MNKLNIGRDLYLKGRIGWQGLSKDEYLSFSDYKIINATSLVDGLVNWDNCGYITKQRYEEAKEIMLQENDILISKDGTLGKIGYVKNLDMPCSVASGIFVLRNTKPDIVDFDYLYHVLKSNIFKDFINRNKSLGSTINHLYQRDLENFELDLLSLKEQARVAKILNDLENKITTNYKTIQTLESLAKTIYDYWFLQFEFPNEEGKPYKSSGGKMVWNEELKREIPEGWEVKRLADLCTFGNGINFDKDVIGDKNYKIVNVRDISASSLLINKQIMNTISLPSELANKYLVKKDDILIARSGTPGAVRLVLDIDNVIYCGFIIHCLPNDSEIKLYLTFTLKLYEGTNATKTGGSILQNVSQDTLKSLTVQVPPKKILLAFNSKLISLIDKMQICSEENNQLTSLRDWLLPMLMNGQVTFKDDAHE